MIIKDFINKDGIKIFNPETKDDHTDYNAKGLDNLYSQEEKHFWFIARKEFILKNAISYINNQSNIIEIGAGTGNVARYLQKNSYKNISVGEMHLNGLRYAQSYGIKNCYQFDLLDTPFENEFDTVCMFDVLEHLPDDDIALANTHKMLNAEGIILLTVPAHKWLWNRDDAVAGHKVRYTKKQLIQKLEKNGFEVLTARYFFIFITPLLLLRRFMNKDSGAAVEEHEYNKDISMNPFLSKALLFLTRIENKLNNYLPNWFGGSLLVVARKK